MLAFIMGLLFLGLAIMGGLWGYNKFIAKSDCGCGK